MVKKRTKIKRESKDNAGLFYNDLKIEEDEEDDEKDSIQFISQNRLKAPSSEAIRDLRSKFLRIESEKNSIERFKADDGSRICYFTYLNIFIYSLAFFIQIGTLPYLTKRLGADTTTFGHLQTVFAVAQLIGGPIYGRIGDLMGEKFALLISFFFSGLSYFMIGVANSVTMLFLSRIPSAFMHTVQGSQMIITFLSKEEDRATVLSRAGFSYGVGMVFGPFLGGYIVKHFGEQNAALISSSGMFLSLGMVYFFIPNIPKLPRKKENIINLRKLLKPLWNSKSALLFALKLLCGIPIGVIQSMFSVIAIDKFGLKADQTGLLLSYIGVITLLMQGVGIQAMIKYFSDMFLMKLGAGTLLISFCILTMINELQDFIFLLFPLSIALCLVNSILTTSLTKAVSTNETGTALGINMAVHSVIRALSPALGGYLLKLYGFESLGYFGASAYLIAMFFIPWIGLKDYVSQ